MVYSRENVPIYPDFEAAVSRWCEVQPTMKRDSVAKLVSRATKQVGHFASIRGARVAAANSLEIVTKVENGVVFTQDRSLRCSSYLRLTEDNVRECLERIACPILVVLGDQGFLFDDHEPWFKQFYPHRKRLVEHRIVKELIVGGGHHVHLDNPEPVARAINALFCGKESDV